MGKQFYDEPGGARPHRVPGQPVRHEDLSIGDVVVLVDGRGADIPSDEYNGQRATVRRTETQHTGWVELQFPQDRDGDTWYARPEHLAWPDETQTQENDNEHREQLVRPYRVVGRTS